MYSTFFNNIMYLLFGQTWARKRPRDASPSNVHTPVSFVGFPFFFQLVIMAAQIDIVQWANYIRSSMAFDPGRQYFQDQIQRQGYDFLDNYLDNILGKTREEFVHLAETMISESLLFLHLAMSLIC